MNKVLAYKSFDSHSLIAIDTDCISIDINPNFISEGHAVNETDYWFIMNNGNQYLIPLSQRKELYKNWEVV